MDQLKLQYLYNAALPTPAPTWVTDLFLCKRHTDNYIEAIWLIKYGKKQSRGLRFGQFAAASDLAPLQQRQQYELGVTGAEVDAMN